MRTPFSTIAPMPICAPSSMTTGRQSKAGRSEESPKGLIAIASSRLVAASLGWKSLSAMTTLYEILTRRPITMRSAHQNIAPASVESEPISR
jgi:hypothetical protein